MNEGYAAGQAKAVLGGFDSARANLAQQEAQPAALHQLCDRMEKQLAAIMESIQRTKQFGHRLLDPRPEKTPEPITGQNPPSAHTVEARLRNLVRAAELIAGEALNVAHELDRAA